MLALIKRNFLLYFRNRSGVILSLFGAIIPFVLYIVFLKSNSGGYSSQLMDLWLIGGVLAVTALTTTLAAFSRQVEDRERMVTDDLFITDLGPWGLQLSYLISSIIIGFLMQVIMFTFMLSYFMQADKISFEWGNLSYLVLLMILNSLLATLINALIVQCFKSVDSLGKLATVVGATSGFLVGTYIPIGNLPNMAQNLMKLTPSNYMASLFRQLLMKESLADTFANNSQSRVAFEKIMVIRIEWQELLTRTETFYIVGIVLVSIALIWIVQNMIVIRRLKLQ